MAQVKQIPPAPLLAHPRRGISRRTFLSLTAAMAAMCVPVPLLRQQAVGSVLSPGMSSTPSLCEICFWKCGIDVWKDPQGRVVQITGNRQNPLSNGRLCPRGTGGMGSLYDPDRIRTPMIRRGDAWQQASWDEALGFIAEKMQAIKAEYGANAMATISHGHGASFLEHLFSAYGSSTKSQPSFAQCRGPRDTGYTLTFGSGAGSPEFTDIENSTLLVLIGSHLGENMHNTQVQEFAAAVDKGLELVVVDPRFSVAAGKAQHWLPVKPGTDMALLLAWIRQLLTEETYNKPFVERHCTGLAELRAAVSPYTAEWAYTQTGISSQTIRQVGRLLGMHGESALVHPGRRTNWYGDDTQRSRANAILNALLGNWGRPGGFWQGQSMELGAYPTPPYPKSDPALMNLARKKFPLAGALPTQFLRDHTLEGGDPPVKGWLVYGSNLLQSIPHPQKTIDALQKLDLLVVVDILPIELAGYADVVLPDTTYLERYDDLFAPVWKKPFVALRQPIVEPLYESRPPWWIAKELSRKLGLEAWFPWATVEEYLDARLKTMGLDLKTLQREGSFSFDAGPPYTETPRFRTPSGKIELYSRTLENIGQDPVPTYTAPVKAPAGFFRLLTGRSPVHSFGRTTNNERLLELMPENELWINAVSALDFNLSSGDRVVLVNQDGVESAPIKVKVTQRIHPECVYMVHGFGHRTEKLHGGRAGADDNPLLTRVIEDPIMGGTSIFSNFVTIARRAS